MSISKYRFVSPGVFVNEIDNSQLPAATLNMSKRSGRPFLVAAAAMYGGKVIIPLLCMLPMQHRHG